MGRIASQLLRRVSYNRSHKKEIQELMLGLDSTCCEAERQPCSYSYQRRVVVSGFVRYAFTESTLWMAGVAQLGEQQTEA
jgi:hypothetical protein